MKVNVEVSVPIEWEDLPQKPKHAMPEQAMTVHRCNYTPVTLCFV